MASGHDKDNSRLVYSTQTGDQRKAGPQNRAAGVPPKGAVRLQLDTKSRRGKTMTRITGLPLGHEALEELARVLKALCGAGGAVEDADILIQGDQRDRIAAKLEALGHKIRKI